MQPLFLEDRGSFLVLALSMMSVVMISAVIGMSLPFVLNKIGFDLTIASVSLITSVCDVSGIVLFIYRLNNFGNRLGEVSRCKLS